MNMNIQEYVERARKAMEEIKDYTQEQVDALVYAAAKVIYDNAEPLAEEAVEETGLGRVPDKIFKNTETALTLWDYLKDKKSVGIINEIPEQGVYEVAHPAGVVALITPATNPTITPLGNFMQVVKGKNAGIVCPAPRARRTSYDTVELIRQAIAKLGAPKDLIQCIPEPTINMSAELMSACDLIVATGSFGLTKAAYSSGKPAYAVGPGNAIAIIDKNYDDIEGFAADMIPSVVYDNGIPCDDADVLLYPNEERERVFSALEKEGMYIIDDPKVNEAIKEVLFYDMVPIPQFVGASAERIAKAANVEIPEGTEVIGLVVPDEGYDEVLNHEIMGPILCLRGYDTFEQGVDMMVRNLVECGGIGHSASVFSNDEEHVKAAAMKVPVSRLLINQPTSDAWGPITNALTPAVSEGCGTWGNNILAGNVDYIHFLNVSKAVKRLDVEHPDGDKVFEKETLY